jgi:ubiquinone biosynthesis protein
MVSIVHAARDIGRLRDISRVLVRHGFGEVVARLGMTRKGDSNSPEAAPSEGTLSLRLRRVLEELGPSFVKLGQIASTRADLLPTDLITELRKLQDSVAPVPFEAIRDRVETALGAPLDQLFVSFVEEPLAAASVAQVHRAVLKTDDGEREVVMKVQRPGIAETIASDLDILHSLAALLERTIPETRVYSPVSLVQQFDRAITNELDFTIEADNAERFREYFRGNERVVFPHIYRQASSKHVICLEFLDGLKITDAVRAGYSGHDLARMAVDLIIKQIFEDGFFHADPHPGNILILGTPEAPIYALIDLGMVGRLSPRMRDLTVDLMVAAFRRDYDAVADTLCALATPTRKIEMQRFRSEVAMLADRYVGKQLKDIEMSALVRDLVRAATKYGMEVPSDFVLVGKTLMTVEGIGKQIAPDLDIMEECRPLFLEILKKRYSPERLGSDLLRRLDRLGSLTNSMPEQLQEVLEDLRRGRLSIRASSADLRAAAEILAQRLLVGLLVGALVLSASILYVSGEKPVGVALAILSLFALFGHAVRAAWQGLKPR